MRDILLSPLLLGQWTNMIFKFPTTIYFGKEHYTEVLEFIVHKRVLIITSKSGRRLHDPIIASLLRDAASQNTLLTISSEITENPTLLEVEAICARAKGERYDLLIAIGGSSVIDSAKAISYMLVSGRDLWSTIQLKKADELEEACIPLLVINSTAGTGSEINNCAVITNEKKKYRVWGW